MNKLPPEIKDFRDFLARRYLRGGGVEIGPGRNPLGFDPERASAKYVDYMPVEEIRRTYGGVPEDYIPGDIIDDGETLGSIPDRSLYWIASCHMLEHTEDPIRVMLTKLQKLREHGVLFCIIPNRDTGFDKKRPVTSLDHFVRDYEEGPGWARDAHLEEFARLAADTPEGEVAARVASYKERDYRIHWHTWTMQSWIGFVQMIQSRYVPFEIEVLARNHHDLVAILRAPGKV
jgi:hypothetical protein